MENCLKKASQILLKSNYAKYLAFTIDNHYQQTINTLLKNQDMKTLTLALFTLASSYVFAQDSEYKVSSYITEGTKAPNTHYLGEAWLNGINTVLLKC